MLEHLKKVIQEHAQPGRSTDPKDRYYGDGGTIHSTGYLDVEVHNGRVVSVWFRCQMLPFEQHDVEATRARDMDDAQKHLHSDIRGLDMRDRK